MTQSIHNGTPIFFKGQSMVMDECCISLTCVDAIFYLLIAYFLHGNNSANISVCHKLILTSFNYEKLEPIPHGPSIQHGHQSDTGWGHC